jgi:hypothetical protein
MGLKETYDDAMRTYNTQLIDQEARYQRAVLDGDQYEQTSATMEMAAIDVQREKFHNRAWAHAQSLQAAVPRNEFGLNDDQIEIAHGIASADRSLTDRDRERIYAQQVHRHQSLVASGQYGGHPGGRSK